MQDVLHSPPTGGSDVRQVSQSVALAPEHVAHDESHGVHCTFATVVQDALSNSPSSHVVQLWHEVLPVAEAYVPSAHGTQPLLPGFGWEVPAAHASHIAAPSALKVPAPQVRHDVLAAGRLDARGGFVVLKLASADGSEMWSASAGPNGDFAWAVVVDGAGDVAAAGGIDSAAQKFAVLRLRGIDGAEVWRNEPSLGTAVAVRLDAHGDVIAAGEHRDVSADPTSSDLMVVKIAAGVSGRKMLVTDAIGAPQKRRLVFQSAATNVVLATPGGPADPTIAGARLDLFNPASGELATVVLPAQSWRGIGVPPGTAGWQYRGPTGETCRKIILRDGKLQAKCSGAGVDFSLDEPAQTTLGIALTQGSGPEPRSCATFGGVVQRDQPATANQKGTFKARNAPAPDACDIP